MHHSPTVNVVFIVMGVSGSGKSAVASAVAWQMKAAFIDGDFLQPRANIAKMAAGKSLDDDDRQPWLNAITDAAYAMRRTNAVSLITCSALKKRYRDMLRSGIEHLFFIYLNGDAETIASRLRARKGHFFKPQMLDTQFAALDVPADDEHNVRAVNIAQPLDDVIAATAAVINDVIATLDMNTLSA